MNVQTANNSKNQDNDTMVFIMKDNIRSEDGEDKVEVIKLRHPRTKQSSSFFYNSNNSVIQEVVTFYKKHSSWFIGNTVNSNGKLYISTTIDPLFLVLPYLYEAKVSSPLDQTIYDEDFPDTGRLLYPVACKLMSLIADEIDLQWNVWKYNEDKTITWLKKKVDRVVEALKKKHVNVNSAVSNTYVKIEDKDHEESILRYAHGIVSDYLPEQLSCKLSSALNIPVVETANENKRKRTEEELLNVKKMRQECRENELSAQLITEIKSQKKTIRKSAKDVALEKAATRTKSISSFFQKK